MKETSHLPLAVIHVGGAAVVAAITDAWGHGKGLPVVGGAAVDRDTTMGILVSFTRKRQTSKVSTNFMRKSLISFKNF